MACGVVKARYGSGESTVCGWKGVGVGKLLGGTVAGIRSGDEAVGEAQEMMKSPISPTSLNGLNSLKGREVMEGLYQRQKDKFP